MRSFSHIHITIMLLIQTNPGWQQSTLLIFWLVWLPVGFSAWISPYATLLELVEDESEAALLTTCYYM
jgi:hypothetical protein|eukprot:COSAG06_NODE_2134_length_7517_cov_52.273928_6_plen_68_part_00